MSENATPATEFAPCHHLTQPCQCDLQKTRNRTHLKCCACHEKWRWTRPKGCACHENCDASSENDTKVLRLPRKTIFNTLQNTSECHEVPRLPHETKQRHVWNLQKWHKMTTSVELPIGTAIWSSRGRLRTVADGCGRLRPQTQRRANTPSTPRPPEWNGNPCYAFGKKQVHQPFSTRCSLFQVFSWCFWGELLETRRTWVVEAEPSAALLHPNPSSFPASKNTGQHRKGYIANWMDIIYIYTYVMYNIYIYIYILYIYYIYIYITYIYIYICIIWIYHLP